eukprot:c19640_g1_i1 orf=162-458(-)
MVLLQLESIQVPSICQICGNPTLKLIFTHIHWRQPCEAITRQIQGCDQRGVSTTKTKWERTRRTPTPQLLLSDGVDPHLLLHDQDGEWSSPQENGELQ